MSFLKRDHAMHCFGATTYFQSAGNDDEWLAQVNHSKREHYHISWTDCLKTLSVCFVTEFLIRARYPSFDMQGN